MADSRDLKHQTQSFVQEIDRQQLNKDCLRIIDLRGRVAGECQRYQFGGRTHYLDDRAYLLVKQLMARFDGRYTNGVYEALFKALRQLGDLNTTTQPSSTGPNFLQLDQSLQRAAKRVTLSTPVQIRIADVLYNGHTIDLTTHALRVSLKRAFTLEKGDFVHLTYPEWIERYPERLLKDLPFKIIKLDHDDHNTTMVLTVDDIDDQYEVDLNHVLNIEASHRKVDVDNELINLQRSFYQRLWLSKLHLPVFWFNEHGLQWQTHRIVVQPEAEDFMRHWSGSVDNWIHQSALAETVTQSEPMLIAFDTTQTYRCSLHDSAQIKALISWYQAEGDRQLYLVNPTQTQLSTSAQDALSIAAEDADTDVIEAYLQRWEHRPERHITVLNLSPLFQHQLTLSPAIALTPLPTATADNNPHPRSLSQLQYFIQRNSARYFIRTPIKLRIGQKQWQLETVDVSADGLSVQLPINRAELKEQRAYIDFTGWQERAKKLRLENIPYAIKNTQWWDGQLRIGLTRIKNNCPESINKYFEWVMAENAQMLKPDQDDMFLTADSLLLGETLLRSLQQIPVFMWLDTDNKRHIELIGHTESNQAKAAKYATFWTPFESTFIQLMPLLKQPHATKTALYAYSSHGQWTLGYEHDFAHSRDKHLFLQRALAADDFLAFHCSLTPLKTTDVDYQQDLLSLLQQWHQQRAHKVKAFRQRLNRLFGMAILTDVTDLVRAYISAN
jgi:uncharacterized protein YcfL